MIEEERIFRAQTPRYIKESFDIARDEKMTLLKWLEVNMPKDSYKYEVAYYWECFYKELSLRKNDMNAEQIREKIELYFRAYPNPPEEEIVEFIKNFPL